MGKKENEKKSAKVLAYPQPWSILQHAKQQVAGWNERKGSSPPRSGGSSWPWGKVKSLLMRDG
jgi:hypothetical protein